MKRQALTLLLLTLTVMVTAQETKNLKVIQNSDKLIEQAMKMADQGKVEDAINIYNSIPVGDPYYFLAQYEKAYAYEKKEEYSTALELLNDLASKPACDVELSSVYTELGNCYDYLNQYDKATEMYQKGLETNPYQYHLWFNKGVSLMRQQHYEEALACFKQSIFLCPSHQGSHFQYGNCCLLLGYTVPGILALNYSILINPENNYAILALQNLSQLYKDGVSSYNTSKEVLISNDIKQKNEFYKDIINDIEMYALSTKKPSAPTKVNHPIAKFNYLVFSNVNVRPGSNMVEDQVYAPFFKSMISGKDYNTLCFYQFAGTNVNDGKIAEKAAKMVKAFDALTQKMSDGLEEVCQKGLFRAPSDTLYLYNRFHLNGWGAVSTNEKGKTLREGAWHFINQAGQLNTVETYRNDILNGLVQRYQNGKLLEEYTYVNNQPNGSLRSYNTWPYTDEQKIQNDITLRLGKLNGPYKLYSPAGFLTLEATIQDGIANGELRKYFTTSELSCVETYENGTPTGTHTYYTPNGEKYLDIIYSEDGKKSTYNKYYISGKLMEHSVEFDGDFIGDHTTYFPSGTISATEHYNDQGKLDGERIVYHRNGTPQQKERYADGKITERTEYGLNGALLTQYTFKNGSLSSISTFKPDGTTRENVAMKGKTITIDIYDEYGHLVANETYNAEGNLHGTQKKYFINGALESEISYTNGALDGIYKKYYASGAVYVYQEYANNAQEGLFIEYYDDDNHQVKQESYYHNDTITRASFEYYPNGDINACTIYDEQGREVLYTAYNFNNIKKREIIFFEGMPLCIHSFNKNGEIIKRDTILFGTGTKNFYNTNGKIVSTIEIKNGINDGLIINYHPDGKAIDTTTVYYGNIYGQLAEHYPTEEILTTANYRNTLIFGPSHTYDANGHTSFELNYENGRIQGSYTAYYPFEKTLCKRNYVDNSIEGITNFYAPDGKTALIELYYSNNEIYAYAFLQKNGRMSDVHTIGKEVETINAYYSNGKLAMSITVKGGMLHDEMLSYYPNGQAALCIHYRYGSLHGDYTAYYPTGKLCKKTSYLYGMQHGDYDLYHENGQKSYEGHYIYTMAHGDFKAFDKTGQVIRQATMYYDIEQ